MKRRTWTTALLISCTALGISIAAAAHAVTLTHAETVQTVQDTLVLPTSYEQYLPLTSPTDVAVSDDYTAIAEAHTIYLYHRARNVYTKIDATAFTKNEPITKMHFADGYLYLLDAGMRLHRIADIVQGRSCT